MRELRYEGPPSSSQEVTPRESIISGNDVERRAGLVISAAIEDKRQPEGNRLFRYDRRATTTTSGGEPVPVFTEEVRIQGVLMVRRTVRDYPAGIDASAGEVRPIHAARPPLVETMVKGENPHTGDSCVVTHSVSYGSRGERVSRVIMYNGDKSDGNSMRSAGEFPHSEQVDVKEALDLGLATEDIFPEVEDGIPLF